MMVLALFAAGVFIGGALGFGAVCAFYVLGATENDD